MKLDVKNIKGETVKGIEVPDSIYQVELNEHLIHSVVKGYRANKRQGTHATKTRSTVSGTGKKPFRQKGTGNARQGSNRGPHQEGGSVAHGPQPRDYSCKINKKSKQLAVKMVLSNKVNAGKFVVVEDFELSSFNTKQVAKTLESLGVSNALLSDERKDNFLYFSARNLKTANVKAPSELNAEDLLRYEAFVISENGLNALNQRLGE